MPYPLQTKRQGEKWLDVASGTEGQYCNSHRHAVHEKFRLGIAPGATAIDEFADSALEFALACQVAGDNMVRGRQRHELDVGAALQKLRLILVKIRMGSEE